MIAIAAAWFSPSTVAQIPNLAILVRPCGNSELKSQKRALALLSLRRSEQAAFTIAARLDANLHRRNAPAGQSAKVARG